MGKLFWTTREKTWKLDFPEFVVCLLSFWVQYYEGKKLFFLFLLSDSFMTHEFMDIPCAFFAFVSEIQCSIFQREEIQFLFQFFFKMKREMTTFAVTQNNGSILQLVHRHNFPHIFVQAKNHLHFVLGQSKVVSFQIVQ